MAGLDPAIHATGTAASIPRVQAGDDELKTPGANKHGCQRRKIFH
jgi:hypothetical protein